MPEDPVIAQMQSLILQWEEASDPKAIFLRCYCMMTSNMFTAVEEGVFQNPPWVRLLLEHFAEYYFVALKAYEQEPATAPAVWQQANHAAHDPKTLPFQKLLLGVNAHINYDLVLAVADLLAPEWSALTVEQRAARYADYCLVNEVISRTIDAVQDQVLEPAMPVMDIIDKMLGPLDEMLVSSLLRQWRESVWQNALRLLEMTDAGDKSRLLQTVEENALKMGERICLR